VFLLDLPESAVYVKNTLIYFKGGCPALICLCGWNFHPGKKLYFVCCRF